MCIQYQHQTLLYYHQLQFVIKLLNASYSIAIAPNGEAANDKHFIVRGGVVPQADAIGIVLGLTMDAADVVRCNTNTSNVSFSIFGSETY